MSNPACPKCGTELKLRFIDNEIIHEIAYCENCKLETSLDDPEEERTWVPYKSIKGMEVE